jgi:hypothetical protein
MWEKLADEALKITGDFMIGKIFPKFFEDYKKDTNRNYLRYVITSTNRPDDPTGSPHKIIGNAMDFTLRNNNIYSGMNEYKDLFRYMVVNWPYRAGADLTDKDGNVHIHIDLGQNHATGMPYFFEENGGKLIREIKSADEIDTKFSQM